MATLGEREEHFPFLSSSGAVTVLLMIKGSSPLSLSPPPPPFQFLAGGGQGSHSVLPDDDPPEDDVGGQDPGDGDEEAPVDRHVGEVPAAEEDAPHGLARERLGEDVRDVPAQPTTSANLADFFPTELRR